MGSGAGGRPYRRSANWCSGFRSGRPCARAGRRRRAAPRGRRRRGCRGKRAGPSVNHLRWQQKRHPRPLTTRCWILPLCGRTPGMSRARQRGGSMPMLDALLTTGHSSGTAPTSIPLLDQARIVSVGSQRPRVSFAKLLDCSRICQALRFNPEDGFRETQRSELRMHGRGLMGRVDGRRIP